MKKFASLEQLFYKLQSGYFAYIPKGIKSEGQILQSRNTLIGQFTEKWSKSFFEPVPKELGLFAVNGVVCEKLGLSRQTSADLAFCTSNEINQKAEDIKLIFEIKMSIVSNYQFQQSGIIKFVGDYKTHKGYPSLMRSDSMLKAIGKSINIRVSGIPSTKIPIVVLGNSPITESYLKKVDFLKISRVIQGFLSLNPQPAESAFVTSSLKGGFQTALNFQQVLNYCQELVANNMNYFSSMLPTVKLGELITIASKENNDKAKAEKFLNLIRS
ncbi:MAG: hypothetical protein QM528_01380 [Phycisphaerales bacterium]|nr:hypothetical protein [Phycisphaerales bacterium]